MFPLYACMGARGKNAQRHRTVGQKGNAGARRVLLSYIVWWKGGKEGCVWGRAGMSGVCV